MLRRVRNCRRYYYYYYYYTTSTSIFPVNFVPNMTLMSQTQQQSICNRIQDRRISIFGHVRRLQGSVPAHEALCPVVNTRAGHRPDDRLKWKRPRGRPRQTWIRQLEIDVGLTADAAWDMAGDRDVWRVQ